jgi:transcriptional regulator with XRE-family HTH domain
MDEHVGRHIGRRMREIRTWRGMSQATLAQLAGFSAMYVSYIERGERTVDKRRTLEAFASALRVAPSELTGTPWEHHPDGAEAHAAVVALEAALEGTELGEDPGVPVRDWPAIVADLGLLSELRKRGDYAAQGELVPALLAELHGAYVLLPAYRERVLLGLIDCYSAVSWITRRLGGRGLPLLAARLAQTCADELEAIEWRAYATWLRSQVAGPLSRHQQYRRAVSMADHLIAELGSPEVLQVYGMLHLSAAVAAAAQSDRGTCETHLDEAAAVAGRMAAPVGEFAHMWFGTANVGVWRTAIAVEFSEPGKVIELARGVEVEAIPSPTRRAAFYIDVGRSMLKERATREAGLATLMRAEALAPQRLRTDIFTREAISDQLRRARRDSVGRELRGLAYRMGISA